MTIKYTPLAALALTILLLITGCSSSNDTTPTQPATENIQVNDADTTVFPGLDSTILKESTWFKTHFSTPIVAGEHVIPPQIEQPNNIQGELLPQNGAKLDGPVMWQRVRCDRLPFSTTDGPTRLQADTLWAGFTKTDLGAALAAFHLVSTPWTLLDETDIEHILPTANKDMAHQKLTRYPDKKPYDLHDPQCFIKTSDYLLRPQYWSIENLDAHTKQVNIWMPLPKKENPRITANDGAAASIIVLWDGTDWKLTPQAFQTGGVWHGGDVHLEYMARPRGWNTW